MRKTLVQALGEAFCAILCALPSLGGGGMMIGARTAAWAKAGYTAKDYVQDGLIAMWDGIENAGWGVHDSVATKWKDLVNGNNLQIRDGSVINDGFLLNMSSRSVAAGLVELDIPSSCTAELCFSNYIKEYGTEFILLDLRYGDYGGVRMYGRDSTMYGDLFLVYQIGQSWNDRKNSNLNLDLLQHPITSSVIGNGGMKYQYANGEFVESTSRSLVNGFKTSCVCIGNNGYVTFSGGNPDAFAHAKYHSLRVYGRNLTRDEISANYAVDKARFNLPDAA